MRRLLLLLLLPFLLSAKVGTVVVRDIAPVGACYTEDVAAIRSGSGVIKEWVCCNITTNTYEVCRIAIGNIVTTYRFQVTGAGTDNTVLFSNASDAPLELKRNNSSAVVGLEIQNRDIGSSVNGIGIMGEVARQGDVTAKDIGEIMFKKEHAWTTTASTNDGKMVFTVALNGAMTQEMIFDSDGDLEISGGLFLGDGTSTGADKIQILADTGHLIQGFLGNYAQFHDVSEDAEVIYATAPNGYQVRTHGSGGGSEGDLMLLLKPRKLTGSPGLIQFGPSGVSTPVQMNGALITEGESNLHGGFRKGEEVGIIAGTTQTQAGATDCTTASVDSAPANICVIGTVGTAGDGVKLAPAFDGRNQCWYNSTGTSAFLYPEAADDIGNGTTCPACRMTLPGGNFICCETGNSLRWYCSASTAFN